MKSLLHTFCRLGAFFTCCVGAKLLLPVIPARAASPRPNVVVVLTDDQGWGDLSIHGNRNLATPRIDELARQGARFARFYVCPVCSPTRAEFLTGRYHPRGNIYSTSAGGERLDLDERTIAERFREAGYATAAFGKWHNGMQGPYHPNARGFQEFYGFCSGHWGNYFSPPLEHNGELVRGNGFVIDDFTSRAMEFIDEHRDDPFFVYLAYNTPHSPMQVPQRWWQRFAEHPLPQRHRDAEREDVGHTRAALAMCENIDWNVGRLLDHLDRLQLAENTIVVYFCDNGPNGFRWNAEMKGRKGSTDEGGVRSPLFIRWPAAIKAGLQIDTPAAAIDLLPTLAALTGIPLPDQPPLDGASLRPLLVGEPRQLAPRLLFSHWRGRVSVRTSDHWCLDHQGQLFDLNSDPQQRRDVADQFPARAAKLRDAAAEWRREVLAQLDQTPRPFSIGGGASVWTQLPARDAVAKGGVKRSNRFPNCSYFTNWTQLDDAITWDVEVLTEGSYEVQAYYTCPREDVGSTIALEIGTQRLLATVAEPHDPPLRGAQEDRVARQESYVKDFKPLALGTLRLAHGRGTLTLRATKIPGSQVMDFRLLMLKRIEP